MFMIPAMMAVWRPLISIVPAHVAAEARPEKVAPREMTTTRPPALAVQAEARVKESGHPQSDGGHGIAAGPLAAGRAQQPVHHNPAHVAALLQKGVVSFSQNRESV
jgi:hypothetical protein